MVKIFVLEIKTETHGIDYLKEIIKCSQNEERIINDIMDNYDNFKQEVEFFDAGHWLETIDLKKAWLNKTEIQKVEYPKKMEEFSESLFSYMLMDYIFDDDNNEKEKEKNIEIRYNNIFDDLSTVGNQQHLLGDVAGFQALDHVGAFFESSNIDLTVYKKKLNKFYNSIKK